MRLREAVPLLHDYLLDAAERNAGKVALVCGAERRTYGELDEASSRLAAALVAHGVRRGDRVLVLLDASVEAVVAFWAVLKADAVVAMINATTKADKLRYLLADSGATALVTHASLGEVVRVAIPEGGGALRVIVAAGGDVEVDGAVARVPFEAAVASGPSAPPPRRGIDVDLASIVYTSGSTGEPKGVMLTHANMRAAATSITTYLDNTQDDVILGLLPLSFDYGLYQMIMAFRLGATLVLERSFTYPAKVMQAVEREGVTGFPGVPTVFAMLGEWAKRGTPRKYEGVRYVTNTAAALGEKHITIAKELFPNARIYSMYGLTECKRVSYLPPADLARKPGSVGIPIPNTEVWVVAEDGQRLPPGQVGELVVRGATVMRGYWRKPEETAKKLRPGPIAGEMVLYTGDLCRLDDEGYLYFVARKDDVLKSRGEKVAPKEVEEAILALPGVREVAVIGVPDEVLGQAVKAFVLPEEGSGLTEAAVLEHCKGRLESYMVPKHVVLVRELPRTTSGKIAKTELW